MDPVQDVSNHHVERRGGGSLLLAPPDVEIPEQPAVPDVRGGLKKVALCATVGGKGIDGVTGRFRPPQGTRSIAPTSEVDPPRRGFPI
ncbi:MAG: hypothetical protein OHK0028_00070 [Deltaproteobacteria bacterium]